MLLFFDDKVILTFRNTMRNGAGDRTNPKDG
jgi:hypothetical protein